MFPSSAVVGFNPFVTDGMFTHRAGAAFRRNPYEQLLRPDGRENCLWALFLARSSQFLDVRLGKLSLGSGLAIRRRRTARASSVQAGARPLHSGFLLGNIRRGVQIEKRVESDGVALAAAPAWGMLLDANMDAGAGSRNGC